MFIRSRSWMLPVMVGAAAVLLSAGGVAGQPAAVKITEDAIEVYPPVEYGRAMVRLTGEGQLVERRYKPSEKIVFRLVTDDGKTLPDGSYSYEVALMPALLERARVQARYQQDRRERYEKARQEQIRLDRIREAGGDVDERGLLEELAALRAEARPEDSNGRPLMASRPERPAEPWRQSGQLRIVKGVPVRPEVEEESPVRSKEASSIDGSLEVRGDLSATGKKSFVTTDPTDRSRAFHYVALEGPEAGTYLRGTARTVGGEVRIELPEHFAKITAADGLTVQLTPLEGWAQLYVTEKSPTSVVVRDADGRDGIEFDYLVQGVREEFADHQVVRPGPDSRP